MTEIGAEGVTAGAVVTVVSDEDSEMMTVGAGDVVVGAVVVGADADRFRTHFFATFLTVCRVRERYRECGGRVAPMRCKWSVKAARVELSTYNKQQ
jgi:hypothetical protein